MITGDCVSRAASMTAWICSMLLTLKAPTPYPPTAASSSSWRMETSGIGLLFVVVGGVECAGCERTGLRRARPLQPALVPVCAGEAGDERARDDAAGRVAAGDVH